jgi:hypothetical protein
LSRLQRLLQATREQMDRRIPPSVAHWSISSLTSRRAAAERSQLPAMQPCDLLSASDYQMIGIRNPMAKTRGRDRPC